MESVREFFTRWRNAVEFAKYDRWCEEHEEELSEQMFAMLNDMDSEHWCWNCKYGDCHQYH